MAISREAFFRGDFAKRSPADRTQHPVIKFLRKNHRNAFTIKQIVEAVGMKEDTVRGFMAGAKKEGLVHHDSPYFMIKLTVNKKAKRKIVAKRSQKKKPAKIKLSKSYKKKKSKR